MTAKVKFEVSALREAGRRILHPRPERMATEREERKQRRPVATVAARRRRDERRTLVDSTVPPGTELPETVAVVSTVALLTEIDYGADGGAYTVTDGAGARIAVNVDPPTSVEVCVALSERLPG